jgi:serine-threonine kinase receptor-associated protein
MFVWAQDTHLLLTGGAEKILRIYDLNRPDAPPKEVDKSPGSVRSVAWLHSDQTILSSCTDMGGVRCSLISHMMPIVVYFCDFCI